MQLHLEASEDLDLPRERVYQLLTDSSFLAKSLPDAEDAKVASAKWDRGQSITCLNRPGIGWMANRADLIASGICADGLRPCDRLDLRDKR